MVVFTSAAILSAISEQPFYAGLSFGAAIFIKHVVVFESLAILYVIFINRPPFLKTFLLLAIGGLVVPLLMIAYIGLVG